MKFIIALTVLSVVALASVNAFDFEPDNPSLSNGNAESEPPTTGGSSASSGNSDIRKALVDEGKKIYKKYVDGGYLSDGVPDLEIAPPTLQNETYAFIDKVESEHFELEEILDEIESDM